VGSSDDFERILKELDEADGAVVEALDKRARAVGELIRLRDREPDGYFKLPRVDEYVARARERAEVFPAAGVDAVMREAIGYSQTLIGPRRVVFVGGAGSFAHQAARKHFGSAGEFHGVGTVRDVLDEVTRSRASHGVIPLETSSDGAITATLHGLAESDVRICAELTLQSSYHLLTKTGNATDVDKICGARPALAACERFLRTEYPRTSVIDVPSGEMAAELAREDHGTGVVGTEMLSELHGLEIARERIEDETGIETRYAVVGNELPSRTGHDRTIVAMAVHDTPGSLYQALQPFADRGINLTRLESRPTPGSAWRYLFFVEMDGHVTDRPILTGLEELRGISRHVKVLGSYPRP